MAVFRVLRLLVKGQGVAWSIYSVLIVGTAISVIVITWLFSLKLGFETALKDTGKAYQYIAIKQGAKNEAESFIDLAQVNILSRLPGVKRFENGDPMASPEIMALAEVTDSQQQSLSIMIRGVFKNTESLRSEITFIDGNNFTQGKRELIIGRRLATQLGNIKVSESIIVRGNKWRVAGIFSSNGDAFESEVWADGATLTNAMSLMGVQSVRLRFSDGTDESSFAAQIAKDSRLKLVIVNEAEFFAQNTTTLSGALLAIISAIGLTMTLAAGIAAASGMLFLGERRSYVFGLLRGFGFKHSDISIALIAEGTAIAAIGVTLGASITLLMVNNVSVNIYNVQTYSQIAFTYQIATEHILIAMTAALIATWLGSAIAINAAINTPPCKLFRRGGNG